MRRMLLVALAAVGSLLIAVPASAAYWAWLEQFSGPGPLRARKWQTPLLSTVCVQGWRLSASVRLHEVTSFIRGWTPPPRQLASRLLSNHGGRCTGIQAVAGQPRPAPRLSIFPITDSFATVLVNSASRKWPDPLRRATAEAPPLAMPAIDFYGVRFEQVVPCHESDRADTDPGHRDRFADMCLLRLRRLHQRCW